MRPHPALALTLLLIAAALTGCLGLTGDDEAADEQAGPSSLDQPPGQAPETGQNGALDPSTNLTTLSFPEGEDTNTTVWANGTFSPEQTCYAAGCTTGSAYERVIIDDELTDGLPVQITATLTYDTGPTIYAQPVDLSLFSEEATIYTLESEDGDDRAVIQATVLGGSGPVTAEVVYRWPTGAEPETSYSLEIELTASRTLVPASVPVAVELAPGDRLVGEAVEEGAAALDLRGPEDARIAHASSNDSPAAITLPSDAPQGEYVVLVPSASQPLRLLANASTETMRVLDVEVAAGELHEAQPGQPAEVSFDLANPPTAVGVYLTTSQPLGASAEQGHLTLVAPGDTLLDEPFGCSICITGGYRTVAWGPAGDASLTAGTYTITYEPGAEAGYGIGSLVQTYQR